MSKIHRSYEVLIEETVTAENREQRKHGTSKTLNHNAKTADALRLTNEMFQDAVCYYTLMLAGMVKDARWSEETFSYAKWMEDKLKAKGWQARQKQLIGQPINPLWRHITNSVEMRDATANVVNRHPPCQKRSPRNPPSGKSSNHSKPSWPPCLIFGGPVRE